MSIEDLLLQIIKLEGIGISNERETVDSLREKISNGCIDFIKNKEGKVIGFYTWKCFENRYSKLDILINNFVISKKHRGEFNILSIRKNLRSKYKNIDSFYWRSRKKQKEISFKERG